MPQATTLYIGLEVYKDSLAVAQVSPDHAAEGIFWGTIGTRQWDLDQLIRTVHSQAKHLVLGQEAGPGGSWLSRDLTTKGDVCWVVAPSLIPKKAGARVNTDRRDAQPLARLMRSGALTPVYVPTIDEPTDDGLTELTKGS